MPSIRSVNVVQGMSEGIAQVAVRRSQSAPNFLPRNLLVTGITYS
ncbi:MAG: hypothetical protein ACI89J_002296 [Hyphomicrobiaceae bacterium]|jgi:hypothetical protein